MSVGKADNSASTVWFRVSTDHAISALYQMWYRRGYGRARGLPECRLSTHDGGWIR